MGRVCGQVAPQLHLDRVYVLSEIEEKLVGQCYFDQGSSVLFYFVILVILLEEDFIS